MLLATSAYFALLRKTVLISEYRPSSIPDQRCNVVAFRGMFVYKVQAMPVVHVNATFLPRSLTIWLMRKDYNIYSIPPWKHRECMIDYK